MKKINELTKEDCQDFLNLYINLKEKDEKVNYIKDTKIEIKDFIINEESRSGIIKYSLNDAHEYTMPICNPYFIEWLYKNDIDITIPLNQLKCDYDELDETNSILFEYAMDVNKILKDAQQANKDLIDIDQINKMKKLQKEMINKL